MEAICTRDDIASTCEMYVLSAALHSLHLYCATVAAALMCCYGPVHKRYRCAKHWRGQNVRGLASLGLCVIWCCGATSALLRGSDTVHLVAALMAPLAWLAAAAFHVALWTRHSAAPILYLAVYWALSALSASSILWQNFISSTATYNHVELYIQASSMLLSLIISVVDCICFCDEVSKRSECHLKSSLEHRNIPYKHNNSHFYSKIFFYWINSFLYKGYESPLEIDDLGELPKNEHSMKYYLELMKIYKKSKESRTNKTSPSIWMSYVRKVWPNFYIAGILKLFGDLTALIPPLGLGVIINFIEIPSKTYNMDSEVTIPEFLNNGYVMLCIVTLALITQALLSQNSTHLVTVEGTRLKTALQAMIYDKCMRLAPWSSSDAGTDEESPLLSNSEDLTTSRSGVLTNLVSQDTYNIMSCVWICHYIWAIPLKVVVILYLLYTKLGVSALIGTAVSVGIITPLQFYIGKKLSDNSKDISKCTDHRISKMNEILQGINVIKLYVWEDLFKEKIMQLREVELKLLNKDSIYWSFLTFSTQISTVIITVVTFIVYYFINKSNGLTAVNVFAGLAFFNQLTVPLLILPVTVLMVIQAMVSTKRIRDFLELPESNNVREVVEEEPKKNVDYVEQLSDNALEDDVFVAECNDQFSVDEPVTQKFEYLVRFRNASFTWGTKNELLEIDDLDIPMGKLIIVVGGTSSGKTSILSAVLGEMFLERGEFHYNRNCSTWYAGQPPWLLERSVRDNIVLGSPWCQNRYEQVLRATALNPDLQLLPEGDLTRLGSHGTPLSGGQRVRVCVARALYSNARLIALDEPLGALDAALARHMVARGLVPAARAGHTIIMATNRLELLHYADLVIAMEDGRVSGVGRATSSASGGGALCRWAHLAAEARAAAARVGAGPPDGAARERSRLARALTRARLQTYSSEETMIGISEPTGAHLLTEVPMCTGGSWRRGHHHARPSLSRQLSSPPPSTMANKRRREVRRAVSADESNSSLHREGSFPRRLLRPRTHRTLTRWTPRSLRRLISSESDTPPVENNRVNGGIADESAIETTYSSITSNGVETSFGVITDDTSTDKHESEDIVSEWTIWREYARACGVWGVVYWAAAAAAQGLALAADYWLTYTTTANLQTSLSDNQTWDSVRTYAVWCLGSTCAAGLAQACCACAGAKGRRLLHERLLHAALHAPLHHYHTTPAGPMLHRFSSDILVIDKKLPTAISRWAQLALLCVAAVLVNAVASPWTVLGLLPALLMYLLLQTVYLRNARELQSAEGQSAASVLSLCSETCAGGSTIRAGRLQERMRADFMQRLDSNHNALLLINAANRWLGLTLDLVGAGSVCISLGVALYSGSSGAVLGLSGTYALLLPAYLAHLAKCRADLDQQLASLHRVHADTNVPQEDYRDYCNLPPDWQRNGKIVFENVSVQHEPSLTEVLHNINVSITPGQKVAICGRSGSGKSTLLLSCVGATRINHGRILIDGQDATRVPLRVLRHRVVVLPQEPVLFSGTLRENLDPLAVHTDEEIWSSLKAVGLCDFVTAQPAGLECAIGKARGGCGGWSAGRAARACAARAALRARLATALLLDEPAAALDAAAERALLAAIAAQTPNVTVLTVAHRVSSVRDYGHAVVLEEGRAVEQGEVSALLAQPYSRLARMLAASRRYT